METKCISWALRLDDEIIDGYIKTGKHEKFCRPFPENVKFHYFKDWEEVVKGSDFVIGGVSSFGVDWFLEEILTKLDPAIPVLSVTKGLRATEDGSLLLSGDIDQRTRQARHPSRRMCRGRSLAPAMNSCSWIPRKSVSAAKTTRLLRMMKEAMQRPYYHISLTNDVIGLESAVVL